ncbi:hypothetical protein IF690_12885 [Pseudomonas sp. SK3(2021)]|uniref:LirA/MavJ family T4SS effector n=1 Tax=Pseudomonas sp. SK3(2021) TaxID=2841064 RepID=UPI00192C0099|nr:LirA/MavJ family T4SS effector [Pseudomonas sp. SK3(2021)]QQZ44378.1 hypothetical protein IF690_12885 [Pseudomonas sp. SK3(2021)]
MSGKYTLDLLFGSSIRTRPHFDTFLYLGVDALRTRTKYFQYLQRIEYDIQRKIKHHFKDVTLSTHEQIQLYQDPPEGFEKPRKVLESVFLEREKPELFTDTRTIISVLSPKQFAKLIALGAPVKDPTINPEHGEYSHRLQLQVLLLMKRELGIPDDLPMVELYKPLADSPLEVPESDEWFGKVTAWDYLFDRNEFAKPNLNSPFNTVDVFDASSPENLQKLIKVQYKNDLPLLSMFFDAREEKRKREDFTTPWKKNIAVSEYVAQKIYRTPFKDLRPEQKQQVLDLLANGGYFLPPKSPGIFHL